MPSGRWSGTPAIATVDKLYCLGAYSQLGSIPNKQVGEPACIKIMVTVRSLSGGFDLRGVVAKAGKAVVRYTHCLGSIASRLKENLRLHEVYRSAGYTSRRDLTALRTSSSWCADAVGSTSYDGFQMID